MLTTAAVMTTSVVTVLPEPPVPEVACVLHERGISGVPVVDTDGKVVGIVSEGDLIGHAGAIGEQPLLVAAAAHRRGRPGAGLRQDPWPDRQGRHDEPGDHRAGDCVPRGDRPADGAARDQARARGAGRTAGGHRLARQPASGPGRHRRAKDVSADDRTIRERLTADLKAQPWAHMMTKNIVVENGVVHLFGFVRSEEECRALRIAAENVPGVVRVEDRMVRRESYPAA
jgi:CBS domain-containing protein